MPDTVRSETEGAFEIGDQRHRDIDPTVIQHPEREDAANKPVQSGAIGCNLPVRDSGIQNILADALACTQGDRQMIYGSPRENWDRTRDIFNAMTGLGLTTSQCVDLAIAMKLARLYKTPNHRDSMVDLAGYAWVKSEVAR